MAIKFTAGVRQQAPLPNRGTIEAWCQVEVDMPATDKGDSEGCFEPSETDQRRVLAGR